MVRRFAGDAAAVLVVGLTLSCGDGNNSSASTTSKTPSKSGLTTGSGASGGTGPTTSSGSAGSAGAGGGTAGTVTSTPTSTATPTGAGLPNGTCANGVPAAGQPVDTSSPTSVVGTGSAASCTFSALNAAVSNGGIITFNCGSRPVTIAVTSTMNVPTDTSTVIDGGNQVTLDGGNAVEILSWRLAQFYG